jgi:hypothetical protein
VQDRVVQCVVLRGTVGATRADLGRGEVGSVAMADPDGNEFGVVRPR